ncbi:MAG: hypothetical protein NC489_31585 [Ruminococcus flavefaciens]|nr:hypothetical protein [Ruminococcus flavefaciens]
MGKYREKYVFNFFKASQEEIREKVQGLARKLVDFFVAANFSEVRMLFEECKPIRYSAQGYLEESKVAKNEKEILVQVGYECALMDMTQMYLERLNVQNEMMKVSTKYRDEILSVLAKRGTMLHGDLASAIQVSASGLNAVIKRMNATPVKLINVEDVSKYKLYSITPIAYKYIIEQKPELTIQIEMRSSFEKEQREWLMQYAVDISKMMNQKKSVEDNRLVWGKHTVWEGKPEKNRKYEKTNTLVRCVEKIDWELAL